MAEPRPHLPLGLLRGLAVAFLLFKLVLLAVAAPFMDETYYWLWGQHPALSYFDHPPLIGWTQGLFAALFGWSPFATRIGVVLTLLGSLMVLWLFARRLAPQGAEQSFWLSALLFLATPIFFAVTGFALPDHLLTFFGLLALYGLYRFLESPERWSWLFAGAVALGLALLSKYTAALIGAGFVTTLLLSSHYRPLFRAPQLYLAGLVTLLMQTPVLVWNAQNGWASFGFVIGGRQGLPALGDLSGVTGYLLTILVFLGPFLLWPAAKFLFGPRGAGESEAAMLLRVVVLLSTLVWLAASVFTNILFHWNLVAYLALLPVLGARLGRRWVVWAHLGYSAVTALLAFLNYALVPVMALISYADQTSAWSYGWDEVAAAVARERRAHAADFVAATDYALAAPLAYALRDPTVTSLDPDRDQFDFWFDADAQAGTTAILVEDGWRPLGEAISRQFARVTPLGSVTVTRFGKPVGTYRLWLGEGFSRLAR